MRIEAPGHTWRKFSLVIREKPWAQVPAPVKKYDQQCAVSNSKNPAHGRWYTSRSSTYCLQIHYIMVSTYSLAKGIQSTYRQACSERVEERDDPTGWVRWATCMHEIVCLRSACQVHAAAGIGG